MKHTDPVLVEYGVELQPRVNVEMSGGKLTVSIPKLFSARGLATRCRCGGAASNI